MAKIGTLTLVGVSGTEYEFNIYHVGAVFKDIGGVYCFTEVDEDNRHTPIYIGITDNLSTRFNNHHKEECIEDEDATCICVYAEEDEDSRVAMEDDLIPAYDPPCNEHKLSDEEE